MKLQKRNCNIKINLHPKGSSFLDITLDFAGNKFSFCASSAIGRQFSELVNALYALYFEKNDCHNEWANRKYIMAEDDSRIIALTNTVYWDNEGEMMFVEMTKYCEGDNTDQINVRISTDYGETHTCFDVDDRELCYAVAKACTDVLKQYGIYGYKYTTEGDYFDINKLIFIKARALNCPEVRELLAADGFSKKTDFNKEIELLLFDM